MNVHIAPLERRILAELARNPLAIVHLDVVPESAPVSTLVLALGTCKLQVNGVRLGVFAQLLLAGRGEVTLRAALDLLVVGVVVALQVTCRQTVTSCHQVGTL